MRAAISCVITLASVVASDGSIFDTWAEVDTSLTCRVDAHCLDKKLLIRHDQPDMPTQNCCAKFPIIQDAEQVTDLMYCYDRSTLARDVGPYGAAYCAGDAFSLFAQAGGALILVLALG